MRKFKGLIQSETAPDINSLWMKDGQIYWFNDGQWKSITASSGSSSDTQSGPSLLLLYMNNEGHRQENLDTLNAIGQRAIKEGYGIPPIPLLVIGWDGQHNYYIDDYTIEASEGGTYIFAVYTEYKGFSFIEFSNYNNEVIFRNEYLTDVIPIVNINLDDRGMVTIIDNLYNLTDSHIVYGAFDGGLYKLTKTGEQEYSFKFEDEYGEHIVRMEYGHLGNFDDVDCKTYSIVLEPTSKFTFGSSSFQSEIKEYKYLDLYYNISSRKFSQLYLYTYIGAYKRTLLQLNISKIKLNGNTEFSGQTSPLSINDDDPVIYSWTITFDDSTQKMTISLTKQ